MWYDQAARELDAVVKYPAMVFPLLRLVEIPPLHRKSLREAAINYVCRSAEIDTSTYGEVLRGEGVLINMTPGGLLTVKRETWPEYNIVHRAMVDFVTDLGLVKTCKEGQLPFCVHVITPKMARNPEINQRPHSTHKMHTDIWAGQPRDLLHLWIPIRGAFNGVSCEWYEPQEFPFDLIRRFENYSDPLLAPIVANAKKYDVDIDFDMAYVSHGFALHRTVLKSDITDLGRLTLDVRFRLNNGQDTSAHKEYAPIKEWLDTGTSKAYVDDTSVNNFRNMRKEWPKSSMIRPLK